MSVTALPFCCSTLRNVENAAPSLAYPCKRIIGFAISLSPSQDQASPGIFYAPYLTRNTLTNQVALPDGSSFFVTAKKKSPLCVHYGGGRTGTHTNPITRLRTPSLTPQSQSSPSPASPASPSPIFSDLYPLAS